MWRARRDRELVTMTPRQIDAIRCGLVATRSRMMLHVRSLEAVIEEDQFVIVADRILGGRRQRRWNSSIAPSSL